VTGVKLPNFKFEVTWLTFQTDGNIPSSIDLLKMVQNGKQRTLRHLKSSEAGTYIIGAQTTGVGQRLKGI